MTLTHPWFLSAAALLVPLTLLFLFRRRRSVATVPSTLLFRRFAISRAKNRRVRSLTRILSFLLCAIAFLALALAATEPTGLSTRTLTIAIVDVSASMGDDDGSPLAQAKERLRDEFLLLGPHDRFALIAAGDTPRVLVGPTADRDHVSAAIDALTTSREGANLERALRVAHGLRNGSTHVVVLHDGNSNTRGVEAAWSGALEEVVFGDQRANVGLVAFSARSPADAIADEDLAVVVAVTASQGRARRVEVALQSGDVTLATREIAIAPGEIAQTTVPIQAMTSHLRAVVRPIDGLGNALHQDDIANIELPERTASRVLLAHRPEDSRQAFFVEAALRSAGVAELEHVSELPSPLPASTLAVVIGDTRERVVGPAIYLGSSEGAPFPTHEIASSDLAIRAVDSAHALTRGVALDGVTIEDAHALDVPSDDARVRSLVELDGGTVLATGRIDGSRFVYLGVDPAHSDVVLRVAFPVLLANAMQVLAGADDVTSFDAIPFDEIALTSTTPLVANPRTAPRFPLPTTPAFLFAGLAVVALTSEGLGHGKGWLP